MKKRGHVLPFDRAAYVCRHCGELYSSRIARDNCPNCNTHEPQRRATGTAIVFGIVFIAILLLAFWLGMEVAKPLQPVIRGHTDTSIPASP